MTWDLDSAYREHLTSADLAMLADLTERQSLADALSSPELEQIVFGGGPEFDPLRTASPFLTFAVAVHGVAARLARATYVEEWIGPRRRVPVFGVDALQRVVADPRQRFFFVELLSSYTHVVSGSTWIPTRRGWRRRRFSELDAVQLAGLLDTVPVAELPGVLRRLGDLALFLTGVFPDHTANTAVGWPSAEARLLRSAGLDSAGVEPGSLNAFQLRNDSAPAGTGSPCNAPLHRAPRCNCSSRSPSTSRMPAGCSTSSLTSTCSPFASSGSVARRRELSDRMSRR